MATLYLIEGPVGAGKSTYAGDLALRKGAVHLDLDEWMVTLFSKDRPGDGFMAWYVERKDRCIDQIWHVTERLRDAGVDAVLELGLTQRAARKAFYARVDAADKRVQVTVLDVPVEVRRQRVMARNEIGSATYLMVVSEEIFELANGAWEAPDDAEIAQWEIEIITPDSRQEKREC